MSNFGIFKAVKFQVWLEDRKFLLEVWRFTWTQVKKYQSMMNPDMTFEQPVFKRIEALRHESRCFQTAVQAVRPTVIGACKAFAFALFLKTDYGTPMPANIEKGIDCQVSVTNDNDGFMARLENKVLSCIGDSAAMVNQHPFTRDHFLHVHGKYIVVTIKRLSTRFVLSRTVDQ